MALSKSKVVDRVTILSNGLIEIQENILIIEDGSEVARSQHNRVLCPCTKVNGEWEDTDISAEPSLVKSVAKSWTSSLKTKYKKDQDAGSLV